MSDYAAPRSVHASVLFLFTYLGLRLMTQDEGCLADGEKDGQRNETERLHRHPYGCGEVPPDQLIERREYDKEQAPAEGKRAPT